MALTRKEVEHIAALVRIRLSDAEAELFRDQLSHILDQFDALRQLDTSGIPPTGHAADLQTVLREDVTEECLSTADVLSNAPRQQGDFFRVKAILGE